jgi:hypothetical protein
MLRKDVEGRMNGVFIVDDDLSLFLSFFLSFVLDDDIISSGITAVGVLLTPFFSWC